MTVIRKMKNYNQYGMDIPINVHPDIAKALLFVFFIIILLYKNLILNYYK